MSEMVERVARAIATRRDAFREGEKLAHGYYDDARAAIEAMHEPTEAMLDAARDWSILRYGRGIGNDAAVGCWQAMIDAALSESEGT